MTKINMEQLLEKAARRFNEDIQKQKAKPLFIPHGSYRTLVSTGRFENGQTIQIKLHGYSFRFLTEENQALLNFNEQKNRTAKLHNHDFFEFIYVHTGKLTQYMPNNSFQITGPHLLMMNSHVIHSPIPENDETVMFNLLIQKEAMESIFTSIAPLNYVFSHFFLESLYGSSRDSNYLSFPLTPQTEETLLKILDEYYEEEICSQQTIYALLIYLFAQIAEIQAASHASLPPFVSYPKETEFIPRLLGYLQEHYIHVTLDELSLTFGYSKSYLSRLIRQKTRRSFKELITFYKMNHARNYLEHSGFSLSKICELVGYYDKSHFSKAFQSVFHISPAEYRNGKRQGFTPP